MSLYSSVLRSAVRSTQLTLNHHSHKCLYCTSSSSSIVVGRNSVRLLRSACRTLRRQQLPPPAPPVVVVVVVNSTNQLHKCFFSTTSSNKKKNDYDTIIQDIAKYVVNDNNNNFDYYKSSSSSSNSTVAWKTAKLALMDALGCGILALQFPACTQHLTGWNQQHHQHPNMDPTFSFGIAVTTATATATNSTNHNHHHPNSLRRQPIVVRVPGTSYGYMNDPVKAAFDIGCCIRWLDYNDTWLAAEWGHPSDNLGAILAVADYVSQQQQSQQQQQSTSEKQRMTMSHVLHAMIQAYEIQGILSLDNSLNRRGYDHVFWVKLASTAVVTNLLLTTTVDNNNNNNKTKEERLEAVQAAVSHAFIDGVPCRTYRQAPNTMSRKSWAAADATSRAVRLAELTLQQSSLNESGGIPTAISTPTYGFQDTVWQGQPLSIPQSPQSQSQSSSLSPYGTYVMEHILFKISFPAEFHAQTACEAAIQLHHSHIQGRFNDIAHIRIRTHEPAVRIISKPHAILQNPADRDHCLEYMVSVSLLFGNLIAEYYENDFYQQHAKTIDTIRSKIHVVEDSSFTQDYYNPHKRSIANAIQITMKDGSVLEEVMIHYPVGHPQRRSEGIPLLQSKFANNLATRFSSKQVTNILRVFQNDNDSVLENMQVSVFMNLFVMMDQK